MTMPSLQSFIDRMVYYCRDVSVGYSQADRWDVRPGGNCDCSSLVITCLREAGFDTGSATYTGNMSSQLTARGWVRLSPYVSKQPGDILLNDAYHVAAMINNYQLAQASISETGGVNGADGDQTGRETNISNYYDYPWNAVLRWNGGIMATTQEIAAAVGSYTYGNGDTIYNYAHWASDNSGAARKDAALARAYLTPRFLGAKDSAVRHLWLPGRKVIPALRDGGDERDGRRPEKHLRRGRAHRDLRNQGPARLRHLDSQRPAVGGTRQTHPRQMILPRRSSNGGDGGSRPVNAYTRTVV